jgi:hypothetical protein
MPTLTIYNTRITAQSATYNANQEVGDPTVISCTSIADATTKLQTALTPLVGGTTATTHANAFSARQTGYSVPSKHTMNFGGGVGATATYKP